MVSISNLLTNIRTLVNQYVYTKAETRTNFNNYIESSFSYSNGVFRTIPEYSFTHTLSTNGEYQTLQDILADDLDEYVIFVESGTYTYSTNATFTVPTTIIGNPLNPPTINCTTEAQWCTLNYTNLTNVESVVKNINWQGTRTINQYGLSCNLGGNKITVDNCSFDGIWGQYNGKALRFYGCTQGSDVTVSNCSFTNNKTTGYGHVFGSIIVYGTLISNLNVNHCTFNNLRPQTTNAKSGANGGGIIISNEDYNTSTPAIGSAIAYCNTYVDSSIDYNYRITESECDD